ncbi:MAG: MFS transporter [Clostridia bacterium]|nr:MFS transporter [Clostridia bacterium]
MKLNYKRTILVGMAFFLITAFWQAYDAIVPLILSNHFGLSETASGAIMSIDNVLAVFMLPIFGALSDKVCSRFGKRTPFIVIGTVTAVIAFVFIAIVDSWQFGSLVEAGIHDRYVLQQGLLNEAKDALKIAKEMGDGVAIEALNGQIEAINGAIAAIRADVLQLTMQNATHLITFIAALLVVLIAMATFRSPAVALMPDVTIKPLRSKGNAIINLTGTAGGMLVLALGILFGTSKHLSMKYVGYVLSVVAIMLLGLIVYMITVKEKKWAREMEEESARFGIDRVEESTTAAPHRKLTRPELCSLILILASVALWYIGYNSVTSKYSVYATNILGFDFNITLIVAQAAAIVAYIPVGMIASRIGRKKTILAGVLMLATAFFIGNFISAGMPSIIMYPIFALAGIGWATINVNSFPMAVELASGSDVGKYTGYYYTASMAAQIVAPILSGMLYDRFGMRLMFFAFATVFVMLSFVTMLFVKHGDSKPEVKGSVLEQLDVEDA